MNRRLFVPFEDKDRAKKLGARWNQNEKFWYMPEGVTVPLFTEWLPTGRLTIELVPQSCWWSNVRSNVTQEQWDIIKRDVYRRATFHCRVCGGQGPKHPVANERFTAKRVKVVEFSRRGMSDKEIYKRFFVVGCFLLFYALSGKAFFLWTLGGCGVYWLVSNLQSSR